MTVIRTHELVEIETPGGNIGAAVATHSRGANEVSVIRQRQRPGGENPAHTHDREEVMVVLAGAVTVTAAGEPHELGPGDALILPARTVHRIENTNDADAEWLLIAPAGVRFFHESGEEGSPPWAR